MAKVQRNGSGGPGAAGAGVRLSTTSYLVLGLVNDNGEATAYELNSLVDTAIGHFWDFPRSQIYAECTRLVAAGFLDETREPGGRRRRLVRLTDAGRQELLAWLATPVDDLSEIRDIGLLKLFLSSSATADDVIQLASSQSRAHEERLRLYEGMESLLRMRPEDDPRRAVLEVGLAHERFLIEFWRRVGEHPPGKSAT